jgi:hypothetical protein
MSNTIIPQRFGVSLGARRIDPSLPRARRLSGIARVEFDYAGAFGTGQWVSVQALHPDDKEYMLLSEVELYVWCAHQFGCLLRKRYPDWNEDTGSCGMFTWDVVHDRILHSHFLAFEKSIAIRIKN